MADVRLVVKDNADLQRYVQFFRGLDSSMVQYYTVSCCAKHLHHAFVERAGTFALVLQCKEQRAACIECSSVLTPHG
jgi:hypothetical protein